MAIPIKNLLNKKTIMSASVGTLMAAAGGIYAFSAEVGEVKHKVADHEVAIDSIKLHNVRALISDLKAERRTIRREMRLYPEDIDLLSDLEEVQDAIDAAEAIHKCITDGVVETCQ